LRRGASLESGRKQWEEIQENVSNTAKKVVENLDIVTRKDFQELKDNVEDLRKRMAILEDTGKSEQD